MTLISTSLNLEGPGKLYEDRMLSEFSRSIYRYLEILLGIVEMFICGSCKEIEKNLLQGLVPYDWALD